MKAVTEFGALIKKECSRLGITQKELARRCGMTPSIMCRYCRGKDTPSRKTVIKIEIELGLRKGKIEETVKRKDDAGRIGYTPSKKEIEVLTAWNRGKLTPEEVSKKTGYSMDIISRYLPVEESE